MLKILSVFACAITSVSAQWGSEAPPPSCSCGNHFEKYGNMKDFNAQPLMEKHQSMDQLTPEEALLELEDDRVCSRCARQMVRVED